MHGAGCSFVLRSNRAELVVRGGRETEEWRYNGIAFSTIGYRAEGHLLAAPMWSGACGLHEDLVLEPVQQL